MSTAERTRYFELREKEKKFRARVTELEGRLAGLEEDAESAEAEACRAELLDEADRKARRSEAERKKGLLTAAKEEVKKSKQAIEILTAEQSKLAAAVMAEIRKGFTPRYAAALGVVKEKLSAVSKAISSARGVEAEMQAELTDAGFGWGVSLNPSGVPDVLWGNVFEDYVNEFAIRCKMNGYEV